MAVLSRSARASAAQSAARPARRVSYRRPVICRAEAEATGAAKAATPVAETAAPAAPAAAPLKAAEWVPEQLAPVLAFMNQDDFKLTQSPIYTQYIQKYVTNEYFVMSTGFKKTSETINGRAAMIGFLAGAGAEIFGSGSILTQLSKAPQPAIIIMALITAGSLVPIVKGTKGEYLESLRDTYTLPEGVFTEAMEKVHGRLAMVGLGGLVLVELLKGSALL